MCQFCPKRYPGILLTCSWTSRHTLASGTVDSAGILLQGLVGDTASPVGCLAVLKLAARSVAYAFDIGDSGRGDGDKAKENGGDGELHIGDLSCEVYRFGVLTIDYRKVLMVESDPRSGNE